MSQWGNNEGLPEILRIIPAMSPEVVNTSELKVKIFA